jgi:SAM-dependent methyltransferase
MSHDFAEGGLSTRPTPWSNASQQPTCRACGASELAPILSLGNTPLANRLLTEGQLGDPEPTYPLDLVMCPACSLVQITATVSPQELFSDYPYFSSFSDTMLLHAEDLVQQVLNSRRLGEENLIIEIASNDGYLLQYYQQAGIPVLGIEPAANVAKVARDRHHIPTLTQFFSKELAERLVSRRQHADVLHANNVLAHVGDLSDFVTGIATLLKPKGVAICEVPYVKDLIDRVEFDTIYHEHLCYFSLSALVSLFARHGMTVVDVEHVEIHGGSLRVFVAHAGQPSARVGELLAAEQAWGVHRVDTYRHFGQRVEQLRGNLIALLTQLKQSGKRIAVYGASAKGSTLLNYFGLGAELLDFVVDRSPVKQGHFTPGTHLRIYGPEKLLEDRPDYCLLLSWNFADEILVQQAMYRSGGGQFIIPIPELKVA